MFALFYFVFEGNFPSTSPRWAYIWRGDLTEGFCVTSFGGGGVCLEGLIHGGAYFRNFTVLVVFGLSTLNSNRTNHKLRKKLANQKGRHICPWDSAGFEHDIVH